MKNDDDPPRLRLYVDIPPDSLRVPDELLRIELPLLNLPLELVREPDVLPLNIPEPFTDPRPDPYVLPEDGEVYEGAPTIL